MPGTVNGAYRMLTEYKKETTLLTAKKQVLDTYKDTVWKPFQQQILDLTATKADGRTLHWNHEPTDNIGKSYLTKHIMSSGQAYCPDFTKAADTFCGYNLEPVVIFDIPRSRIDTMDHIYGVIEKLHAEKFSDVIVFVECVSVGDKYVDMNTNIYTCIYICVYKYIYVHLCIYVNI